MLSHSVVLWCFCCNRNLQQQKPHAFLLRFAAVLRCGHIAKFNIAKPWQIVIKTHADFAGESFYSHKTAPCEITLRARIYTLKLNPCRFGCSILRRTSNSLSLQQTEPFLKFGPSLSLTGSGCSSLHPTSLAAGEAAYRKAIGSSCNVWTVPPQIEPLFVSVLHCGLGLRNDKTSSVSCVKIGGLL